MSFASGTLVKALVGVPPAWTFCVYDGEIAVPTGKRDTKKFNDQQRLRARGAHFVRRTPTHPREFVPYGGVRAVDASGVAPPTGALAEGDDDEMHEDLDGSHVASGIRMC